MPNQNEARESAPTNEMSERCVKLISDLKAECEELAQKIEKKSKICA